MSTVGAFCLDGAGAGSGVPQALLSVAEDQGSNIAALFCETRGGGLGRAVDLDGATAGAERLNAELKFDDGDGVGTLVGGGTGGAGDANPAKSSPPNRSRGADETGFEIGLDDWAKAKSRPLEAFWGGED
jgi:hypothetical protein